MELKKRIFYIFVLFLIIGSFVLWTVPFGAFRSSRVSTPTTLSNNTTTITTKSMSKKIALVIAFQNFRDEEYFVPKEILEGAGYSVITVSTKKGTAVGADGGEVVVATVPAEVSPQEYEAVVFVGGPGMAQELDNEEFQELARKFVQEKKLVAAICIAPCLLAKAGILQGKQATVWSSPLDKSPIKILTDNGAIYQRESVVRDDGIITANGPSAASSFGEKIVQVLQGG